MTSKFNRLLTAGLIAMAMTISTVAMAQSRGFVDLDSVRGLSQADVTVDINIGGWLMGLVHSAAEEGDDEDTRILKSIENVRVRVFELSDDNDDLRESFADLSNDMRSDGWDTLVKVREDDDHVDIMVIGSEDMLEGIAILAISDDDEAVMVNITGEIDPADVASIIDDDFLGGFDVDLDI